MERRFGNATLLLLQADITTLHVDGIVNAANAALAGGGGVDGAIHRAGGPAIAEACRALPYVSPGIKCPTGDVRSTTAGRMRASWVLHTVGPIYDRHEPTSSARLLERAYRSCLDEGVRLGCRTLAFPSLSTGAYGYPIAAAARIAMETVTGFIRSHPDAYDRVTFALYSPADLRTFEEALQAIAD